MATLISCATGNFTSSSTWALCDPTAELDSEAISVVISTSNLDSSTFTPGAITVDGIALKLAGRAGSPAGTFTVTLRNSTDATNVTSVTVNVSDLPAAGNGWHFFKFASSELLVAGKAYLVRVACSNIGSQVSLFRNATANNWSRQLRTTTTQAPAAGDKLFVMGEYTGAGTSNSFTVTMNETATTSYGPTVSGGPPLGMAISNLGTLTYGTSAATNYYLRLKGILAVYRGGTLNIGTSGTPMPSDSTAVLEFDVVTNVDGGLAVIGGTCNAYGATKATIATYLNTDEAASATVIGVVSTSGWEVGDSLAFASTTRTATEAEKKVISTVDSATQVTLTAGLTNAHSGTSPTQAEVINLTRNVKIRGTSTSLQGHVYFSSSCAVTMRYIEFSLLGSNTNGKRGLQYDLGTGTVDIQYCSLYDFSVSGSCGLVTTGASTTGLTFSNNVGYNHQTGFISLSQTSGTWTISGNVFILVTNTVGTGYALNDVGGTFTNNVAASVASSGGAGAGIHINEAATLGTFSGNVAHACGTGLLIGATLTAGAVISNLTVWRTTSASGYGIRILAAQYNLVMEDPVVFGCSDASFNIAANLYGFLFKNVNFAGDSSFSTTYGILLNTAGLIVSGVLESGSMGVASGIKVAHSGADIRLQNTCYLQLTLRNCNLASTTPVSQFTSFGFVGSYIRAQRWAQTNGSHRSYYVYGTIEIDSARYRTAAPSQKVTPNNASVRLESAPARQSVDSGATASFGVYVYKDAAYNGNQPRLVLKKNVAAGITDDTVLDTVSGGTGEWEQLTGTSIAVTDDAVLEAVVDCDGTAGYINVDDWSQ